MNSPGALAGDCTGEGLNNGSFPGAVGNFRTLWGVTATTAANMGCINDASLNSDIIQIKRAIATPVLATSADRYYIASNTSNAEIFAGGGGTTLENSQMWEYQHHVYYVKDDNGVPVLMQGRLTNSMTFDPVIDGIERIRFMYGVDTTDDGVVNVFLSADNMTDEFWDRGNGNRVLAVKIYVLARSANPDNKYTNNNVYQLGDMSYTPNDNFRRLLFTSTVTLFNARVDFWPRPPVIAPI
jgi:type IV pilus assembly protein PilW